MPKNYASNSTGVPFITPFNSSLDLFKPIKNVTSYFSEIPSNLSSNLDNSSLVNSRISYIPST